MGSAGALALLKVATDDLPERDRLPLWQDFFAQKVVLANVEPLSTLPLRAEVTFCALPGARIVWFDVSTPMRGRRTTEIVARGGDSFVVIVKHRGHYTMSQRGFEVSPEAGEAFAVLQAEPSQWVTAEVHHTGFIAPCASLASLVKNVEDKTMRRIPKDNDALRLLIHYAALLRAEAPLTTPELSHLASTHIRDLIAMALGPTPDGAAIANDGGVRAARLSALKADILGNLTSPDLTVCEVARRQGVTPRYIHMLFESEGVTFSEFVCEARLRLAYGMLLDPRFVDRNIMTIAFAAGFGDLSYFNRCFRRRFGAAPSEVRCGTCPSRNDKG